MLVVLRWITELSITPIISTFNAFSFIPASFLELLLHIDNCYTSTKFQGSCSFLVLFIVSCSLVFHLWLRVVMYTTLAVGSGRFFPCRLGVIDVFSLHINLLDDKKKRLKIVKTSLSKGRTNIKLKSIILVIIKMEDSV